MSAATPPAGPPGKNLTMSKPRASAAISSDAVATPGMKGRSLAAAASSSSGVAPGSARSGAKIAGSGEVLRRQHGANADNGFRHFGDDCGGRIAPRRGPQRDLEQPQATGYQGARQRHGVFDVLDRDDRDDRREPRSSFSRSDREAAAAEADVMRASPCAAPGPGRSSRPAWPRAE